MCKYPNSNYHALIAIIYCFGLPWAYTIRYAKFLIMLNKQVMFSDLYICLKVKNLHLSIYLCDYHNKDDISKFNSMRSNETLLNIFIVILSGILYVVVIVLLSLIHFSNLKESDKRMKNINQFYFPTTLSRSSIIYCLVG